MCVAIGANLTNFASALPLCPIEPCNGSQEEKNEKDEKVPAVEVDRGGLDDTHQDLPEKTCTEYYLDNDGKAQQRQVACPP